MNTLNNEESTSELKRTWGAYPEIQKEHPYSDQCIAALISKMEAMAGAPREDGTYERQPGERCSYELPPKTKTKTTTMAQVP